MNNGMWKILVAEKRSRGKVAVGLITRGFEQNGHHFRRDRTESWFCPEVRIPEGRRCLVRTPRCSVRESRVCSQVDILRRFAGADQVEHHERAEDERQGGQPRGGEHRRLGQVLREAAVRESVEALTLRRGEEGGLRTFIDTTNVGDNRWGPPLVDEGWHAVLSSYLQVRRASGMCSF